MQLFLVWLYCYTWRCKNNLTVNVDLSQRYLWSTSNISHLVPYLYVMYVQCMKTRVSLPSASDWRLSWDKLANQAIILMILCPLLLHSENRLMNNRSTLSSTYLLILFDHSYHPSAVYHTAHLWPHNYELPSKMNNIYECNFMYCTLYKDCF